MQSRIRRSVLYMPGDSLRKITKATQMQVDSIVMDLEDGVAHNRKAEGRQTIVEAIQTLDFGPRERLIRINPPDTPEAQEDLAQTMHTQPDGYVIPKVEDASTLTQVCEALSAFEKEQGLPQYQLTLLALIETARGVLQLPQIVAATPRLSALMFGSEDLAGDIGAQRTPEGWEVFYARSAVVTAAAAYKIDAIDTVFPDFHDLEGLEKEATFAKQLGYVGKMAIHPRQVDVFNRVFAPTPDEIKHAQALIEAHQAHQDAGTGAFAYEGKMVDMPMIRSAQTILARAHAAGLLP